MHFSSFALTACEKEKADLVFLLDMSGSIGVENYAIMINFTAELLKSFKVSNKFVRVGLAQFSDTPAHEFFLNDYSKEEEVVSHVLRLKYSGGNTYIGKALDHIKNYFKSSTGSRYGVSKNLVLITDGDSYDDVEDVAERVRALGVEMFAIGIGNFHSLKLLQIAGDPQRLFNVRSFSDLENIKNKLFETICKSKPIPDGLTPTADDKHCEHICVLPSTFPRSHTCQTVTRQPSPPVCTQEAVADIVFMVDGSWSIGAENFEQIRRFLYTLVNSFDVGPEHIRIGLVQYSTTPRTEFLLNTHQNKRDILQYISRLPYMGGGTQTGQGLDFMLNEHFVEAAGSRARQNVPQIAVVITDGKSQDNVETHAQELKGKGIVLYAIGIKDADEEQLKEIANEPHGQHVYTDDATCTQIFVVVHQDICGTFIIPGGNLVHSQQ
uniref:VWFA domain-containing protein n=1 Tax=Mola mola TaxID=94237 RepID=A0A3Q3X029_MOLML